MMNQKQSSQSVRAIAAAGLAACSFAGVADQAEAEVVWTPGPVDIDGTYSTVANDFFYSSVQPNVGIDFDQDGRIDFTIFYYESFRARAGVSDSLTGLDGLPAILFNSAENLSSGSFVSFNIDPYTTDSLSDLYANALVFDPLTEAGAIVHSFDFEDFFNERRFVGVLFVGGDGEEYVGYVDLQITPDSWDIRTAQDPFVFGDGSLTIYGSGFAAVPEPGSLALLGASGLVLLRRRRRA